MPNLCRVKKENTVKRLIVRLKSEHTTLILYIVHIYIIIFGK